MPLLEGGTRGIIGKNIAELMKSGRKKDQAVAIALNKAGKSKEKYK